MNPLHDLETSDQFSSSWVATIASIVTAVFATGLTMFSDIVSWTTLIQSVGLACLLIHGSIFLSQFVRWSTAGIIWPAAVVLLTASLLYMPQSLSVVLLQLATACGFAATIANIRIRRIRVGPALAVIAAGLLISWLCIHQAWLIRNPLVIWGWANRGDITFPDPNFQSAIAACIQTYNIPSVGLHGVEYIPYHHATNFVIAGLARGLGVNCLVATHVVFPIVFLPVFFWQFMRFVTLFSLWNDWSTETRSAWKILLGWSVCFVGFGGFFPNSISSQFYIGNDILAGENTALGLAILFGSLELTIGITQQNRSPFVAIFAVALTTAVLTWTKIMVAHMGLGLLCLWAVRCPKENRFKALILAVFAVGISLAVSTVTVLETTSGRDFLRLQPFGFIRSNINPTVWGWYYPCVGWYALVYALFADSENRIRPKRFSSIVTFGDSEFAWATLLLAIGPGLVLGGKHSQNCFQYIYCGIVIGTACVISLLMSQVIPAKRPQRNVLRGICCLLLAAAIYSGLSNSLGAVKDIVWWNTQVRGNAFATPLGMPSEDGKPNIRQLIRSGQFASTISALKRNSEQTEASLRKADTIWSELQELSLASEADKKRSLLYISRSVTTFWNSVSPQEGNDVPLKFHRQTRYLGFMAVAWTGIALLDGGPEQDLSDGRARYFLAAYSPARHTSDPADSKLLSTAKKLGAEKLYLIHQSTDGSVSTRVIE